MSPGLIFFICLVIYCSAAIEDEARVIVMPRYSKRDVYLFSVEIALRDARGESRLMWKTPPSKHKTFV